MMEKTNVMRILDRNNISYKSHCYKDTNAISGIEVAEVLHENKEQVLKTLVTISKEKHIYVFMVPVSKELDLKKAAKVVSEKSLEMLKQKDLLPTTGYVHGGCSPIGMKKEFPVVLAKQVEKFDHIIFSAGKVGYQVEMSLSQLLDFRQAKLADITKE